MSSIVMRMIQSLFRSIGYVIVKNDSLSGIKNSGENSSEVQRHVRRIEFEREGNGYQGYEVKVPYSEVFLSGAALQKVIEDFEFESVLDIGAGALEHSKVFRSFGKKVTAIDFGVSIYFQQCNVDALSEIEMVVGDFNVIEFSGQFDCIWASHVLEHQVNIEAFLSKVWGTLKEGGVLAITVPPLKHEIVGGHVSLWNAGLVLYRLVLAGFDCRDAAVLSYGYNISVVVQKKTRPEIPQLEFDCGDIRKIKEFLPMGLVFNSNAKDDPFEGNIQRLNWT